MGANERAAQPTGGDGQGGDGEPVAANECRPLFDRESLAAYLRLSTDTVDRLVKAGRLPCVRIGHQVRFTSEDVEGFIARHRWLGPAT